MKAVEREFLAGFDPLIHAPHRLRICAILAAVHTPGLVEFAVLRDELGVSESVLSKQISALEEAGYIAVVKGVRDRKVRGSAALSGAGRTAFEGHLAALRVMTAGALPG